MKNYELFDMIGDVDEEYVLAAGRDDMVRPRARWKGWVACAACAALVLGAWPAWKMAARSHAGSGDASYSADVSLIRRPGLHEYTLVEEDRQLQTTRGDVKAPGGEESGPAADTESGSIRFSAPAPVPGANTGAAGFEETGDAVGGARADSFGTWADAPVDEGAASQYDRLLQGMGIPQDGSPAAYPDWFAGAWIDHSGEPAAPARLTVAVVDGLRTQELEARIRGWCGGTQDVQIVGAKYPQSYLDGLMEGIGRIFEELDCRISSAYGVYVMDNYLGLDFFGETPSDEVLAALAELDPQGDAIRIQVFMDQRLSFTEGSEKGPAPNVPGPDPAEPADGSVHDLPEPKAAAQPTPAGDLPEHDVLHGADE